MWYNKSFFKYISGVILVLLMIFLFLQLSPIINRLIEFVATLLLPLLFSGILYYILRPVQIWLEGKKIPRLYAILLIYLVAITLFLLFALYSWPFLVKEMTELKNSPALQPEEIQRKTLGLLEFFNFNKLSGEQLKQVVSNALQGAVNWMTQDLLTILARITQITTFIIITPIILFYLLKDGDKFLKNVLKLIPNRFEPLVKKLLSDCDSTLSVYITGQFIVGVIIGSLLFIGYSVIGLEFAFLLAIVALIFSMIPFVGMFLSMIPALVVGGSVSFLMSLKVLSVILAVHAIDANFISPNILGARLNIHPLTLILLLIACGSLYGILGLLLATPVYALLKVLAIDIYRDLDQENGKE